jgi:hypothetical protein
MDMMNRLQQAQDMRDAAQLTREAWPPLRAQRPPPSALVPLSHLSNVVQTRLDDCLSLGAKSPKADEIAYFALLICATVLYTWVGLTHTWLYAAHAHHALPGREPSARAGCRRLRGAAAGAVSMLGVF